MADDSLKKKRAEYAQQFQQVAGTIQALRAQLSQEEKHLEQLRGAVAALDELERSMSAPALAPAAEQKEGTDGQKSA